MSYLLFMSCGIMWTLIPETSDRSPRLLSVQLTLTPGLYPGPGVNVGPGFYQYTPSYQFSVYFARTTFLVITHQTHHSLELSFYGTYAPIMRISPFTFTVLNLYSSNLSVSTCRRSVNCLHTVNLDHGVIGSVNAVCTWQIRHIQRLLEQGLYDIQQCSIVQFLINKNVKLKCHKYISLEYKWMSQIISRTNGERKLQGVITLECELARVLLAIRSGERKCCESWPHGRLCSHTHVFCLYTWPAVWSTASKCLNIPTAVTDTQGQCTH